MLTTENINLYLHLWNNRAIVSGNISFVVWISTKSYLVCSIPSVSSMFETSFVGVGFDSVETSSVGVGVFSVETSSVGLGLRLSQLKPLLLLGLSHLKPPLLGLGCLSWNLLCWGCLSWNLLCWGWVVSVEASSVGIGVVSVETYVGIGVVSVEISSVGVGVVSVQTSSVGVGLSQLKPPLLGLGCLSWNLLCWDWVVSVEISFVVVGVVSVEISFVVGVVSLEICFVGVVSLETSFVVVGVVSVETSFVGVGVVSLETSFVRVGLSQLKPPLWGLGFHNRMVCEEQKIVSRKWKSCGWNMWIKNKNLILRILPAVISTLIVIFCCRKIDRNIVLIQVQVRFIRKFLTCFQWIKISTSWSCTVSHDSFK